MALNLDVAAPRAATTPPSQATIEQLQDERRELVEQYVGARPTGSDGWKLGVGIATGLAGAAAGVGAVLLSNRGKGAMYQGFNMMFMAPIAMAGGGAIAGGIGARLAEIVTRPSGDAARSQVDAQREELRTQIDAVDTQLAAADGRRPQPLPSIDDSTKLSIGRVAGHAAAGIGFGMLATGGVIGGLEALRGGGRVVQGGPSALAPMLLAPAAAAGAISYFNQRDEAAGGQGSALRSAGIGAAALAAASLVPAMKPLPIGPRMLGAAAIGAAIGTVVHAVSVSSRD